MKKLLFLLFCFTPLYLFAQHTVSGKFVPSEKFKWGLLYQITPTSDRYTADTKIDGEGNFSILLDSTVTPGTYRFVYATPPEEFNFEFIYSGKEDVELTFSETEGLSFSASEENKVWNSYQLEMAQLNEEIERQYQSSEVDVTSIELLIKVQRELQNGFEMASKNKIAGSLIRASKPYLPIVHQEWEAYQKQQKIHYFDAIDVNDTVLQESRFLFDRCTNYIRTTEDIDAVASFLSGASKEFQKSLLANIWQALVANDLSEFAVYLSKNHLRPLAEELGQLQTATELLTYERLAIDAIAPDFSWESEDQSTQRFHELTGVDYYILVFWSSGCPHCLKELPKLHTTMESLPKEKYQVVAFGLEDDLYNWRNESLRLPSFLHIPGLGKWENEVAKTYAINRTPTYFLLDKDKRIMGKPADLSELEALITGE